MHNLYTYDEHDRLTSEYNALLGYKYVYEYDCGGNITAKKYYVVKNGVVSSTPEKTDTYSYNDTWKDQLSEINGKVVSYDESGNITGYADKTFVWKGKRVASINGVALEYDYNGLRVLKGSRKYYWQNGNLKAEVWSENGTENRIYYRFDESGVSGFNYNGKEYYYRKNTLGDVLAIYDANGTLQCKYAYDAWGNHKVYAANGSELTDNNAIGNLNPIRYRSYYWDKEFALYYLQSRYYAPELGRFISPDGINYLNPDSVIGLNLYVYCGNNPVMGFDPDGTWDWNRFFKGALIVAGALAAVALTVATFGTGSAASGIIIAGTIGAAGNLFSQAVIENKSFAEVNYLQVAVSGISSAVSAIPGVGFADSIVISGASGFLSSLAGGANPLDALLDGVKSAGITAIAGGITRGIGLGKISKIGKGNYSGQKTFLNNVDSPKLARKLSCFKPSVSKEKSLMKFIKDQVGLRGLSRIASDTAGTVINTVTDIITSILP